MFDMSSMLEMSTQFEMCSYHPKKKLDQICLDENCPKKGLICTHCAYQEHSGHKTVPVEVFLQALIDQWKKPYVNSCFKNYIDKIENLRQDMKYQFDDLLKKVQEYSNLMVEEGLQFQNKFKQMAEQNCSEVSKLLNSLFRDNKVAQQKDIITKLLKFMKVRFNEEQEVDIVLTDYERVRENAEQMLNMLNDKKSNIFDLIEGVKDQMGFNQTTTGFNQIKNQISIMKTQNNSIMTQSADNNPQTPQKNPSRNDQQIINDLSNTKNILNRDDNQDDNQDIKRYSGLNKSAPSRKKETIYSQLNELVQSQYQSKMQNIKITKLSELEYYSEIFYEISNNLDTLSFALDEFVSDEKFLESMTRLRLIQARLMSKYNFSQIKINDRQIKHLQDMLKEQTQLSHLSVYLDNGTMSEDSVSKFINTLYQFQNLQGIHLSFDKTSFSCENHNQLIYILSQLQCLETAILIYPEDMDVKQAQETMLKNAPKIKNLVIDNIHGENSILKNKQN